MNSRKDSQKRKESYLAGAEFFEVVVQIINKNLISNAISHSSVKTKQQCNLLVSSIIRTCHLYQRLRRLEKKSTIVRHQSCMKNITTTIVSTMVKLQQCFTTLLVPIHMHSH